MTAHAAPHVSDIAGEMVKPAPPRETAEQSLKAAVELHYDFVWRLLRRLGLDDADAEDAAQHVFLVAADRGIRGRPEQARPFLYGIALRVAANFRRSIKRRREVSDCDVDQHHAVAHTPDEQLELRRAMGLLDEVLDKLPMELRLIFCLAEIEQMTAASIAELERIPPGTVASRLRRARELFDMELERVKQRNPFVGSKQR